MPNRIKELRKENGLTLDALSDKVNIKRGTLNNYENEKTEPKLETWKKLASYFDVSVGYLQGLSDIKNPYKTDNFIYNDNGEFKRNDNFDFEMFKKEGAERVAEGNSDDLTAILNLLRKQAGDDDAENYNDAITNRNERAFIYTVITSLVDDAMSGGFDNDYLINANRIIDHFNKTMANLIERNENDR